jgi:hypothetical protein
MYTSIYCCFIVFLTVFNIWLGFAKYIKYLQIPKLKIKTIKI